MVRNGKQIISITTTIGLLIIVGIIGWYAYNVHIGTYSLTIYTPPSISKDNFLELKKDGEVINAQMDMDVEFYTTVLSAKNDILVKIKIYPNQKWKDEIPNKWEILPNKIGVLFPKAISPEDNPVKGKNMAMIEVSKDLKSREYHGEGHISYQFEDEYGFFYLTEDDLRIFTTGDTIYLTSDLINQHIIPDSKFKVSSSESLSALQMNNTFLALTLVFIGFALIELRSQIIDGVSACCFSVDKLIKLLQSKYPNQ